MKKSEVVKVEQVKDTMTHDDLINVTSGMGLKNRGDTWSYNPITNNYVQLENAFEGDWVAKKVCSIIPSDMVIEWRKFTGDLEPENIKSLERFEKKLNIRDLFRRAQQDARIYGTGYLILNIDGHGSPNTPLDYDKLRVGQLKKIVRIDRRYIDNSGVITTDPYDDNYMMPESYTLSGSTSGIQIHHTRVLRFEGEDVTQETFKRNSYRSNSSLVHMEKPIKQFQRTAECTSELTDKANINILKINGLFDNLEDPTSEQSLKKHIHQMNASLNNYGLLTLDGEDDFVNTGSQNLSSLDSLIRRFLENVASAIDIPVTRFLQTSSTGIFVNGSPEERRYSKVIFQQQQQKFDNNLSKLDVMMSLSLGLNLDIEEDLVYEWISIIPEDRKERLESDKIAIENMTALNNLGVIDESIIAKEVYDMNMYTNLTIDDVEEVEKYVEESKTLESNKEDPIDENIEEDIDNDGVTKEEEKEILDSYSRVIQITDSMPLF